jgi:hypothetical protein
MKGECRVADRKLEVPLGRWSSAASGSGRQLFCGKGFSICSKD